MRRAGLLTASIALFLLASAQASAQSVQLVPFGGQTYASPFYVTGEPGDPSRVYVVEGAGRIRLVINGATQATAFLDINSQVFDQNEGGCECGIFSMAFAPDYATSGLFYVFYTRDASPGAHVLRIEEFKRSAANPDLADPATRRIVLEIPHLNASNHNGGQLQFGPDGLLYISTGDGGIGQSANGQSTAVLLGKILRIDPAGTNPGEYSIPADNPFVGAAGADEIYSYGLRNPYRFSFDRLTGDLTIGDVGAGTREEVDFVPIGGGRGANFGWSCFEGSQPTGQCGTPPANHTPPVLDYTRVGSNAAVNGGYVVRDGTLPSLLGRYLYADTFDALSDQIHSALLFPGGASGNAPTGLTASFVVSFGEDACGHVYVAHGNTVSRIQPSAGAPACQPQTVLPPPDAGGGAPGLALNVDLRKARRGAARREVTVIVSCDSACSAHAEGRISLRGRDIGLDPDDAALPLGVPGALDLGLSGKGARRLRGALAEGRRAVARIELLATGGGGTATVKKKARQRR
jgi:glucose/arabinose dehydrogenase